MSKVADAEMLQVFGRTDPEQAKRDKKHNDELQQILDNEFFASIEEDYEWMSAGRTILDLKEQMKSKPAPVVLYGAGRGMLKAITCLDHFNLAPQYLSDRNRDKINERLNGMLPEDLFGLIPIHSDTLISEHINSYILITVTDPYIYLDAYNFLCEMGVSKERLFAIRSGISRGGGHII